MRIREITFHNFRSFRGEKRISFVDPLTDSVRPMTVIAGTNGAGKSTVLDTSWALLRLIVGLEEPIIFEALRAGLVSTLLELSPPDLLRSGSNEDSDQLYIMAGQRSLARQSVLYKQSNGFGRLSQAEANAPTYNLDSKLAEALRSAVWLMYQDPAKLHYALFAT
jgi:predicted ATPase